MAIQMNEKFIRLTESDLHRIVKESVYKVLNEHKHTVHIKKRYKVEYSGDMDILPCTDNTFYRWGKDENGRYLKVKCENGDKAYVGDYLCLGYDKKWYIQKLGIK